MASELVKILLYSLNFAPEVTGVGRYSGDLAFWLADHGHQVRVVTAPPYYPDWQVADGYSGLWYRKEAFGRSIVQRCPLYVPAKPSGVKRLLHLASFAVSSFPVVLGHLFWRPDVVWVVEPALLCAPAAWITARLAGTACWLHVQDFEVDAAFAVGLLPERGFGRIARAAEGWLTRRFDRVSSISLAMVNRLLREGGISEPVLFPNPADLEAMRFDEDGRGRWRNRLGLSEDRPLCLYSGNIAAKQGLEVVLAAARRLPEVCFLICGSGAYQREMERTAKELGIGNLTFLPLQPEAELASFLSAADIHLVIQRRGISDLVLPSKISNILAIGGVALVTADPETELGRGAVGPDAYLFRCDPEDPEALVRAIQTLECDAELRESLSRNAKHYAARYLDRDAVFGEFEKHLMDLVRRS